MLRFDSRELTKSNEGEIEMRAVKSKTGHAASGTKITINLSSPRAGCPCSSIYSGRLRVLLHCLKCP
jgi:hypothetical protein